jgi:hypothetical protein
MKKLFLKTRLVLGLLSFGGGFFHFLAALLNMASNYQGHLYEEMGTSL